MILPATLFAARLCFISADVMSVISPEQTITTKIQSDRFSKKYNVDNKHSEIALTDNTLSEQARQDCCASKLFWSLSSALGSVLSNRRVEPSLAGEFLDADSSPVCDGGEIPPWECSVPQVKTRESESISTANKASRHTYLLHCVDLSSSPSSSSSPRPGEEKVFQSSCWLSSIRLTICVQAWTGRLWGLPPPPRTCLFPQWWTGQPGIGFSWSSSLLWRSLL